MDECKKQKKWGSDVRREGVGRKEGDGIKERQMKTRKEQIEKNN